MSETPAIGLADFLASTKEGLRENPAYLSGPSQMVSSVAEALYRGHLGATSWPDEPRSVRDTHLRSARTAIGALCALALDDATIARIVETDPLVAFFIPSKEPQDG